MVIGLATIYYFCIEKQFSHIKSLKIYVGKCEYLLYSVFAIDKFCGWIECHQWEAATVS